MGLVDCLGQLRVLDDHGGHLFLQVAHNLSDTNDATSRMHKGDLC